MRIFSVCIGTSTFRTYHEYLMGKCIATTCTQLIKYISSTLNASWAIEQNLSMSGAWKELRFQWTERQRANKKKQQRNKFFRAQANILCMHFFMLCVFCLCASHRQLIFFYTYHYVIWIERLNRIIFSLQNHEWSQYQVCKWMHVAYTVDARNFGFFECKNVAIFIFM